MKRAIRRTLRRFGYEILKVPAPRAPRAMPAIAAIEPIWPLPRRAGGPSDAEMREAVARHALWHYAYAFEGGLSFATSHTDPGLDTDDPRRPHQRFRHLMPHVVAAQGGSLRGKRVLDIACNSGYWSIQCALLGADVIGFDARPELIEQATWLKQITGATSAQFRVLDFWAMTPEALGGTFDVVLNLGFLYHVATPIEALARTRSMAHGHVVLDTAIHPADDVALHLKWEEPTDIRMAAAAGFVAGTRSSPRASTSRASTSRTGAPPG
jgi:2-polyprenyl-3-methyl-5-hydroxy-6-metoxy-1,4-benzoquinol methylase